MILYFAEPKFETKILLLVPEENAGRDQQKENQKGR